MISKETNIWEETILMVTPPTDEQVTAARLAVCARAESPQEAEEFMRMLGLL